MKDATEMATVIARMEDNKYIEILKAIASPSSACSEIIWHVFIASCRPCPRFAVVSSSWPFALRSFQILSRDTLDELMEKGS